MSELINLGYWAWFGLATALIIAELVIGSSFFLLWIAIAACLTGVVKCLMPTLLWQYLSLLFSAISILSIALWRYALKRQVLNGTPVTLNQKSAQLIGKHYTLAEPIQNGRGKITIGDTVWLVSGPDLKKGSTVQIIEMEGAILKVEGIE